MIRNPRVALLLMIVMGATAGVTVPAASAAEWHVGGVVLAGEEKLAEATKVEEPFTLSASGVTITCNAFTVKGGFIKAPNASGAEHLVLGGCKASGACTVASTLETKPVKAVAKKETTGDVVIFEPNEGTNFITIEFKGAECTLKGNKEVTGKITTTVPTGEKEEVEQELAANSSNELKIGTSPATFKGKDKIKLVSGKLFSFR